MIGTASGECQSKWSDVESESERESQRLTYGCESKHHLGYGRRMRRLPELLVDCILGHVGSANAIRKVGILIETLGAGLSHMSHCTAIRAASH